MPSVQKTASEKMYANINREIIPFVGGAQEFHSYVYGSEFTNHRSQTAICQPFGNH